MSKSFFAMTVSIPKLIALLISAIKICTILLCYMTFRPYTCKSFEIWNAKSVKFRLVSNIIYCYIRQHISATFCMLTCQVTIFLYIRLINVSISSQQLIYFIVSRVKLRRATAPKPGSDQSTWLAHLLETLSYSAFFRQNFNGT